MAVYRWIKDVQDSRSLMIFAEKAFTGGWATVLVSSIKDFNRLVDSKGIKLVLSKVGNAEEANIILNSANKYANVSYGGTVFAKASDGTYTHGLTRRIEDEATRLVKKAYVFVPATPRLERGNPKSREVGPKVRNFILVHEFIHAAGVGDSNPNDDEHTLDDVFCSPISIVEGRTAAGDIARTQGRNAKEMPPFEINDKTSAIC
ncbi:MAG: hypothetical protein ACT4SY_06235 [Hyphomicrobiales bacterium]